MLTKTRGVVLNRIKYSDNSHIVTIYTEAFGRQSYMVRGIHAKKSTFKPGFFQPLFILDLEVYCKPGRSLQRIKELKIATPFKTIPYEIAKNTQAIFLADILNRCLKEEEPNSGLFEFLINTIQFLDLCEQQVNNFHLLFLIKLTAFLGIYPNGANTHYPFFDLRSGTFVQHEPSHPSYLNPVFTKIFTRIMETPFEDLSQLNIPNERRKILLDKLTEYYHIHQEGLGEIKSLQVLKEVFH